MKPLEFWSTDKLDEKMYALARKPARVLGSTPPDEASPEAELTSGL